MTTTDTTTEAATFSELVESGAVRIAPAAVGKRVPLIIQDAVATILATPLYDGATETLADTARDLGGAFLADHTHECLSDGAWSLALEGAYDWPHLFHGYQWETGAAATPGVYTEPGAGWRMDLYPEEA